MRRRTKTNRRATLLLMVVGLLATLFLIISAYITLARFDSFALESTQKAEVVDDILDSLNSVVLSAMVQSWADADGNLLAGGRKNPASSSSNVLETYAQEDRPGDRATRWLAGNEPVRDRGLRLVTSAGHPDELLAYKQTVSAFGSAAVSPNQVALVGHVAGYLDPGTPAARGLMLENPDDDDTGFEFYDSMNSPSDVLRNVRRPFMDADGDGVPDSFFVATASLTEMANAVANVAVRAPQADFDPSAIGDPNFDFNGALWRRFDDQARYEVAVKVISNGGLVPLTSPGDYTVPGSIWNREFVTGMFNWVRHPQDRRMFVNEWYFDSLARSAETVEPFLRHRGGLLANYVETLTNTTGAVPVVLRLMQDRNAFFWTMRPTYNYFNNGKQNDWQRFNLATVVQGGNNEWFAWRRAATLDPDELNSPGGVDPNLERAYVRRQLLTTISNSDELAREVDSNAPSLAPTNTPGIYPGQLKFYLGDIARAFDTNGRYVLDQRDPTDSYYVGNQVVRRLANYFYEMLGDYEDWDIPNPQSQPAEVVSRRQQACMLAVNTVAFAAPRTSNPITGGGGFIDAVWYRDQDPQEGVRTYIGYAPQPFITQVVAYSDYDEDEEDNDIALAVELYYPHDPGPDVSPTPSNMTGSDKFTANDPFALSLDQFAISLNDNDISVTGNLKVLQDPLDWTLPRPVRLSGRQFLAFAINDSGGNATFDNLTAPAVIDGVIGDMPVTTYLLPDSGNDAITVKLWRYGSNTAQGSGGFSITGWYQVDEFTLDFGSKDPDDAEDWIAFEARDTTADTHLGGDWDGAAGVEWPARWRVVSSIGMGDATVLAKDVGITLAQRKQEIGNAAPAGAKAPSIPLYTMNAGDTNWGNPAPWSLSQPAALPRGFFTNTPIHGTYRPKSYPTVGFMHFVPRYAHTSTQSMSETLKEQWDEWDGKHGRPNLDGAGGVYPADFGHMPIFDNHQEVDNGSYYDDENAGQIPWGLLVYDYFTTLDRNADHDGDGQADIDPRRVAGRININTAPWYVLAGLPIVNPYALEGVGVNPPDPAFWSATSGILVGEVTDPIFMPNGRLYRFEDPTVSPSSLFGWDAESGWYRLGPLLGQAIAAYRDQVRYTSDVADGGVSPLWAADRRNNQYEDTGTIDQRHVYRREKTGDIVLGGFPYGTLRRGSDTNPNDALNPRKHGFVSLGELVNVKGFDSPVYNASYPGEQQMAFYSPLGRAGLFQPTYTPDFFRAVSLMALLDTQFLVTRSNTFTVYMTLTDRDPDRQEASVRTQLTVDRSNLLPELVVDANGDPILQDTNSDTIVDAPIVIQNRGLPEVITKRQASYFGTQFDQ